jgi:hypothetical protein
MKHTEDRLTRIEFAQSVNANGECKWHWTIWVQNGHPYAQSKPVWKSLQDCMRDFDVVGEPLFMEAQSVLGKQKIPS